MMRSKNAGLIPFELIGMKSARRLRGMPAKKALPFARMAPLVSILLFFLSSIWGDFLKSTIWSSYPQDLIFMAAVVVALPGAVSHLKNLSLNHGQFQVLVGACVVFSFVLFFGLARGYSLPRNNLAFAPIVALLFYLNGYLICRRIAIVTLVISAGLTIYEYALGQYVYVYVKDGEWLDEKSLGANAYFFRAKGIFAGPTSAAGYAVVAALYAPKDWRVILIALSAGFLTGSRSPLFFFAVMSLAFCVFAWAVPEIKRYARKIFLFLVVIFLIAVLTDSVLEDSVVFAKLFHRLTSFGSDDTSNLARFYYWNLAWDYFWMDYSAAGQLFGMPKSSYHVLGNSAENQWLQYLLDVGVVGAFVHLMVFIISLARSWQLNKPDFFAGLGLCTVMFVVALTNQTGAATIMWIWLWKTILFSEKPT